MPRRSRIVLFFLAFTMLCGSAALAQRRGPIRRAPSVHVSGYVFVGGYFYDPWFGPYPWWQRNRYPYPYYPVFDQRADLRILVTPSDASVYVDGFYAGIVEDFNGFFERLSLPPGGHEIVLYRAGYRTARQRIYLSPASTFRLEFALEPLRPGERSEPPSLAPPLPPPPQGSYIRPRTPGGAIGTEAPPVEDTSTGTITLRVLPATATVVIDGEQWFSSDGQRFIVELPAGTHRVEITSAGYQRFVRDVQLHDGQTVLLNVSLLRQ